MAKEITNPVSLVVTVKFDEGIHIESSRVDYGITYSEYPDDGSRRKSCDIVYSEQEETAILSFMNDVVKPQIIAHENPPED